MPEFLYSDEDNNYDFEPIENYSNSQSDFVPIESVDKESFSSNLSSKHISDKKIMIIISILFLLFFLIIFILMFFCHGSNKNSVKANIVERPAPVHRVKEMNIKPSKSLYPVGKKFRFSVSRDIIFKGDLSNVVLSFRVPENVKGRQKIEEINIEPKPTKIETTEDGKFAYIELPHPQGEMRLTISGVATIVPYDLGTAEKENKNLDGILTKEEKKRYTSSEDKIECNKWMQNYCATRIPTSPNVVDTVKNIFDYVASSLKYNIEDTGKDKGAMYALQTNSGVCMEFAELMTAFCRMKGIPARVVLGFNIPLEDDFLPKDSGHAWVEVYFPEYGWVDFDPTNDFSKDILQRAALLKITPFELMSKIYKNRLLLRMDTKDIDMYYEGKGDIRSKNVKIQYSVY